MNTAIGVTVIFPDPIKYSLEKSISCVYNSTLYIRWSGLLLKKQADGSYICIDAPFWSGLKDENGEFDMINLIKSTEE